MKLALERQLAAQFFTDSREQLWTRIAWLYYCEGLTQTQIAKKLGTTRLRVNRILAACRKNGLVQIHINSRLADCVELEGNLCQQFGLAEAIVVPSPVVDQDLARQIGMAAGAYVSERLRDGQTIGVGWGRALFATLQAIKPQPLPDLSIFSLMGGLTRSSTVNPYEIAWRFADLLEAKCYYIAAPIFTTTKEARSAIMAQEFLSEAFERASRSDMALLGLGHLTDYATSVSLGLLDAKDVASLRAAGAVGDFLGYFLKEDGELADHSINERVVALSLEQIKSIKKVVVIAGGEEKVRILRGVLRAGYASALVTDATTAENLLAPPQDKPAKPARAGRRGGG